MKRATGIRPMSAAAAENYEHMLTCLICRSLFDDHDHQPKFLPCHHTFCKECLREYVRQIGDDIECPSCRKVATIPAAGVTALQTNFYAKYIQTLVYGGGSLGGESDVRICEKHPTHTVKYFCDDCAEGICDLCTETSECSNHHRSPIAAVAERFRQNIDVSFTGASTAVSRKKVELEGRLRALADEKDRALLRIDSAFEAHAHTLARRATLLKNKVIDIYNENSGGLEAGLEEVDTAMTCIVSLREYYEAAVGRGDFESVTAGRGAAEIDEVARNIGDRVRPPEIHIVFDGDHGNEKFRTCTKDLGRVVCNRSVPRRPDSTSSETQLPSASGGVDSIPASPDHFSPQDEFGGKLPEDVGGNSKLASGDGLALASPATPGDAFGSFPPAKSTDCGGGECPGKSSAAASLVDSSLLTKTSPASLSASKRSTNKFTDNVMPQSKGSASLVNNNYYSHSPRRSQTDLQACGIGANVASGDSGVLDRRSFMSYDEQQLKRELGILDPETGDAGGDLLSQHRMSRSEYWTLTDGSLEPDDEGRANVVAELSGEQTTL